MDKPGSKHAASISSDRLPPSLICPVVSRYCDHYASIEFNLLISRVVAFAWWPIISPHGRMEGARSDGEGDREGSENRVFRRESLVEIKCGNGKVRVV